MSTKNVYNVFLYFNVYYSLHEFAICRARIYMQYKTVKYVIFNFFKICIINKKNMYCSVDKIYNKILYLNTIIIIYK